jgi:extradiol dioxygenase family protein
MILQPFHLAIVVDDLQASRKFYGGLLGCEEGRSAAHWIDFDLFGHQLVCHLSNSDAEDRVTAIKQVDVTGVPVPHFGVVLKWSEWKSLHVRLAKQQAGFLMIPRIRFEGLPGEQGTFFIADPSGNALEFKALRNPAALFDKND